MKQNTITSTQIQFFLYFFFTFHLQFHLLEEPLLPCELIREFLIRKLIPKREIGRKPILLLLKIIVIENFNTRSDFAGQTLPARG